MSVNHVVENIERTASDFLNGLIGIDNDQTLTLHQMKAVIRNLLWTLNKRLPLRNSSNFRNTVKLTYECFAAIYARYHFLTCDNEVIHLFTRASNL